MRVVVVEEGRRFTAAEFRSRHPLERWTELYRDAGSTMTLGTPPILLPIGRGVGGTTLVNSATCYRPPQDVLVRWRDDHGLALADPDELSPFVEDVWSTVNAEPVSLDVMGRNEQLALEGARKLGWHAAPLDHNAVQCGGCCQSAKASIFSELPARLQQSATKRRTRNLANKDCMTLPRGATD